MMFFFLTQKKMNKRNMLKYNTRTKAVPHVTAQEAVIGKPARFEKMFWVLSNKKALEEKFKLSYLEKLQLDFLSREDLHMIRLTVVHYIIQEHCAGITITVTVLNTARAD